MKADLPVLDLPILANIEKNEWLYWQVLYQKSGTTAITDPTLPYFIGAIPEVDILAYNRVIGLGVEEQATNQQIKDILRFFSSSGVSRFFVQVSPYADPAELSAMLRQNGFKYYNNWVKFYRKSDLPVPDYETDLEIVEINRDYADLYGEIVIQPFGWESYSEILAHLFAGVVGQPGYRHYFALDGDTPVAAAALYAHGENASLAMAGTLEEYRGRGAQSALLARRIKDAREMGCHYLYSETAEDTPKKGSPSYRNLRRFGFEVAYLRANYICNLG